LPETDPYKQLQIHGHTPMADATSYVQEASIEITVIRADGTREDLGVVSYWNKNPLKRLLWRIKQWL
jgi:hypothetical protein